MRKLLITLLLCTSTSALAEPITLTVQDWSRPRTGQALVQLPALQRVLEQFQKQPDGAIVIAHSTGEAGQLWAEELGSWLVALGVSSERLRLEARPELSDTLILDVRERASL